MLIEKVVTGTTIHILTCFNRHFDHSHYYLLLGIEVEDVLICLFLSQHKSRHGSGPNHTMAKSLATDAAMLSEHKTNGALGLTHSHVICEIACTLYGTATMLCFCIL